MRIRFMSKTYIRKMSNKMMKFWIKQLLKYENWNLKI